MRKPAKEEPATIERKKEIEPLEFEIELITPLLGGGARPREVDGISWLRSAAAKSAIRGWWRIAFAHLFTSPDKMRAREEVLFGAQGRYDAKGTVLGGQGILGVFVGPQKIKTKPFSEPVESPLNGAYFAANVGGNKAELGEIGKTISVKLTFHSPFDRKTTDTDIAEIKLATNCWLVLGGAGGRTRRSAGALALTEIESKALGIPTTREELKSFLLNHCRRVDVSTTMDSVFCLARTRSVFIGSEFDDANSAHKKLLEAMREARQDRIHPANWKNGDWGRSRWPEADAIRFKAGRTHDGSEWSHVPKKENAKRYPRAALGLPIVVYFMVKSTKPHEPNKHHIYAARPAKDGWEKLHRYASPIILRVVRVWQGTKPKFVPVAIFTDCTLPEDVRPLVSTGDSDRINRRDVVEEYSIRASANETLLRIATHYERMGFEKVQESK